MTYTVQIEKVGILKPEDVRTVHMERKTFLNIVKRTVKECFDDSDTQKAVRKEIMPTAQTMPRYPLGRWFTDRGCGCVVGEYLVAKAEMDRAALVEKFNDQVGISTMLGENPLSYELQRFGYAIDSALENHLRQEGVGDGFYVSSVRSIEIDN